MENENFNTVEVCRILNEIMEYELSGVVRYTHSSLMVVGPHRLPIVDFLKEQEDIIKEGVRLGVMFKDTWTCYSDREDGLADATTPSSSMSVKGFIEAGFKDPIAYVQQEKLNNVYKENNCKDCS